MVLLMRGGWSTQEIAAELADVLKEGAVPPPHVAPELPRREFLADDNAAASDQSRPRHQHATDAVIHRQAVINPIVGLRMHHPRKPVGPLQYPAVADGGCFR